MLASHCSFIWAAFLQIFLFRTSQRWIRWIGIRECHSQVIMPASTLPRSTLTSFPMWPGFVKKESCLLDFALKVQFFQTPARFIMNQLGFMARDLSDRCCFFGLNIEYLQDWLCFGVDLYTFYFLNLETITLHTSYPLTCSISFVAVSVFGSGNHLGLILRTLMSLRIAKIVIFLRRASTEHFTLYDL